MKRVLASVAGVVFVLGVLVAIGAQVISDAPPAHGQSVAATIAVISAADSGAGTLRQALLDAESGDTITFEPAVFPPGSPVTIALASGLPEIDQGNLTIDGSDAGVILDGSGVGATPETLLLDDVSLTVDGGPNLIVNGDFGGGLGHWRPWDERPGARRSLNDSDFHTSPNSYRWDVVAGARDSRTVYDTADTSDLADAPFGDSDSTAWIPATGGSTVELRFWHRYDDVSVTLYALFADDEDDIGDWWFDAETDWTQAVVVETLPGDAIAVGVAFASAHSERWTQGLSISSSNNAVRGLQVVSFPGHGIVLGAGGQDNVIGGDSTVGAGPLGQGNLIGDHGGYGVQISGSGTMSNGIRGNYIGTDVSGAVAIPNADTGVFISDGASYNTVGGENAAPGGTCSGECNLISGADDNDGVRIAGDGTSGNIVSGNYIGTDASGTQDLGNDEGGVVICDGASHSLVGGDTPGERNLISGNDANAVVIEEGATHNTVSGNYIGTDVHGTTALPNENSGVLIKEGASYNLIGGLNGTPGGACTGACNLISGNGVEMWGGVGVKIEAADTTSNTVSGNYIGISATGATAIPNCLSLDK